MAVREVKIEKLVHPVYYASRDVIEAVRTLILRTEELEGEMLRRKLPEVEMSQTELNDLDSAVREMHKAAAISLEEFNQN